MQRYLQFLSLAVSLLVNVQTNSAISAEQNFEGNAAFNHQINLLEVEKLSDLLETASEKTTKPSELIVKADQAIAQTINPTPSEIIVPLPKEPDASQFNQPTQSPEAPKPEAPKPEITDPILAKKILDAVISTAIANSSNRYPWLINPSSNLLESTLKFTPAKTENYTDVDAQYRNEQLLIRNFDYAVFPQSDQFYWVLPQNRIAIETRGWQAGIDYQGQETNVEIDQQIKLTQSLWGLQAVWSLPQPFRELYGEVDTNQLTIQTISGEVTNPVGILAPSVILNDRTSSSAAVRFAPRPPRLGTGSSNSPRGGQALFQSLESENAPLILQAFPTNNLQSLLEAEGLFVGANVPQSALNGAGIGWRNPFTGQGKPTAPAITSLPGIKIGQSDKFDNLDLLNILVNPNLSRGDRDRAYLNSLFWISLGQRTPQILQSKIIKNEYSLWHRLLITQPHNRSLLQYATDRPQATYSNVFANPGFSLSFSLREAEVNDLQTLNSSLGLLLGGVFSFIRPQQLTESLEESRDRYDRRESFSTLQSTATRTQRALINQRLNRGLYFANRTSGLSETSGTMTFPSTITPDRAQLFQIRAGNQRRLARFAQVERTWKDGQTFFSRLRLSNKDFGRLSFVGMPVPAQSTGLTPNRSAAVQVSIQTPDGQTFEQDFSAVDSTVVPLGIRSSDLAFDRIELSQIGRAKTQINRFEGYLYLPTVETLWSASLGNWNYTVNSGLWWNLNGDVAFDVSSNNVGDPEPSVGAYVNALINHTETRVLRGAKGKPQALISEIPSLRLSWSTAANRSNPGYLNLSYTYARQQENVSYSITPGFFLTYDNDRLAPIGFFQGQLGLPSGFEFRSSLELNSDFFYLFETLQRLSSIWSAGLYVQNYRSSDSLISRVVDLSYGVILRNQPVNQGLSWRSRLGMSGNEVEVRLEGSYQF